MRFSGYCGTLTLIFSKEQNRRQLVNFTDPIKHERPQIHSRSKRKKFVLNLSENKTENKRQLFENETNWKWTEERNNDFNLKKNLQIFLLRESRKTRRKQLVENNSSKTTRRK